MRDFTLTEAVDRAADLRTELLELSSVLDLGADGVERPDGAGSLDCAVRIMRNVARQLNDLHEAEARLHIGLTQLHAADARKVVNG